MGKLNRRDFIKLFGLSLNALLLPIKFSKETFPYWFKTRMNDLPSNVGKILKNTTKMHINKQGYLNLFNKYLQKTGQAPIFPTQWNRENRATVDQLPVDKPWAIVLHWFGDNEYFDKTVEGYIRGFDSLRQVGEYTTRTSAHFLVGQYPSESGDNLNLTSDNIGIIQTQTPTDSGTPFVASHLRSLDLEAHAQGLQYFVKTLYQLEVDYPETDPLLTQFFDGPSVDPNTRTISIEITGLKFDNPEYFPIDQQISNLVSLIWAIMKRYSISSLNILGHHEIELRKSDPGKKFIAFIRYLIGIKALVERDIEMKQLVFSPFLNSNYYNIESLLSREDIGLEPEIERYLYTEIEANIEEASISYFMYIREYLALVGTPRMVYEWESISNFWQMINNITDTDYSLTSLHFSSPVNSVDTLIQGNYLDEENREGVNFFHDEDDSSIHLISEGLCLYSGVSKEWGPNKKLVVFKHRQADGAEIISIYDNLTSIENFIEENKYPIGIKIGTLKKSWASDTPFLHFAIGYASTWGTILKNTKMAPLNAGPEWIKSRYLNPIEYLEQRGLSF